MCVGNGWEPTGLPDGVARARPARERRDPRPVATPGAEVVDGELRVLPRRRRLPCRPRPSCVTRSACSNGTRRSGWSSRAWSTPRACQPDAVDPRIRKGAADQLVAGLLRWEGAVVLPMDVLRATEAGARSTSTRTRASSSPGACGTPAAAPGTPATSSRTTRPIDPARHREYYRLNARNRVWLAPPQPAGRAATAVRRVVGRHPGRPPRWRHPRRLRRGSAASREGWTTDCGPVHVMGWLTIGRMALAGRPPSSDTTPTARRHRKRDHADPPAMCAPPCGSPDRLIRARRRPPRPGTSAAGPCRSPAPGTIEVAVYFADGPVNLYQVRQWYAPLAELAATHPVAIVSAQPRYDAEGCSKRVPGAHGLRPPGRGPGAVRRGAGAEGGPVRQPERPELPDDRYGRMWHVFVNHGESDKMYMTTNQFKAYDYALIAGDAARDRLAEACGTTTSTLGPSPSDDPRPTTSPERCRTRPTTATVVLYAPTWEGEPSRGRLRSIASHGTTIADRVLATPQHRLVYRPHPRSGVRDGSAYKAAHEQIVAAIGAGRTRRPERPPRVRRRTRARLQLADADVAITDISAMIYDRLAVGRPPDRHATGRARGGRRQRGYLGDANWLGASDASGWWPGSTPPPTTRGAREAAALGAAVLRGHDAGQGDRAVPRGDRTAAASLGRGRVGARRRLSTPRGHPHGRPDERHPPQVLGTVGRRQRTTTTPVSSGWAPKTAIDSRARARDGGRRAAGSSRCRGWVRVSPSTVRRRCSPGRSGAVRENGRS